MTAVSSPSCAQRSEAADFDERAKAIVATNNAERAKVRLPHLEGDGTLPAGRALVEVWLDRKALHIDDSRVAFAAYRADRGSYLAAARGGRLFELLPSLPRRVLQIDAESLRTGRLGRSASEAAGLAWERHERPGQLALRVDPTVPFGLVRDVIRVLRGSPLEFVVTRAGGTGVVAIGPPAAEVPPTCSSGRGLDKRASAACEAERLILSALRPPSAVRPVATPENDPARVGRGDLGVHVWVTVAGVEVVRDRRLLDGSCSGAAAMTNTPTVRRGPAELSMLDRCLDLMPPCGEIAVGAEAHISYARWLQVAAALTERCRTVSVAERVEWEPVDLR